MKSRLIWILMLAAVLLAPLAVFGLWPVNQPTAVVVKRSFVLDTSYVQTVTSLRSEDAIRKIVVLGNSEFVDQIGGDGGPLGLGLGGPAEVAKRLFLGEDLQRRSELIVRTHDAYVGEQLIRLELVSNIGRDEINSVTQLQKPKGRLLDYRCQTRIAEDGTETLVDAELRMEILTYAPRLFRWVARRRVRAAAVERLKLLEDAFREVTSGVPAPMTPHEEAALPPAALQPTAVADWRRRHIWS